MRKFLPLFLVPLVLAFCGAAEAQQYRFAVPKAEVTVDIARDGSALIHYRLTFTCSQGAHAIDIVDIGMPNMGKGHEPVRAAINGRAIPLSSVRISTYLKPKGSGYEIHLGSGTIGPGATGVFEFVGREKEMVWQDTTDPEQASFRFTPTWFGSQYVVGDTELLLRYRLPIAQEEYGGVKEKILWQKQGQEFSAKGIMEGEASASVVWARRVMFTGPHEFGVSFPGKFMTNVRKDGIWEIFLRWVTENPSVRIWSGLFLLVGFGIVFLVTTRGTGCVLLLLVLGGLLFLMTRGPAAHLLLFPVLAAAGTAAGVMRSRRKKHYFPAEVHREGGGIKRGLTAVQAALLLELPFHRVLAMIIFGLAKKGLVEIDDREPEKPLKVKVLGRKKGTHLWDYEKPFLEAFGKGQDLRVEGMDLSAASDAFIKGVVAAVEGFDLEETRKYYRYIVSRAWKQVQAESDLEALSKRVNKDLGWLMMDENWESDFRDLETGGRYHVPRWWPGAHSRPAGGPVLAGGGGGAPPAPGGRPSTSFSDVASSVIGRLENVSGKLTGKLDSLSQAGSIDLSSVDRFTGKMFEGMAKGGGGGGGGGCACACAGCACACACAGGGR